MASTGTEWTLKTENEQYLSSLERKLAQIKSSPTASCEPSVNGTSRSPSRGFLLPRPVLNGDHASINDFGEGSSSFSGSSDGASTIIPADDEVDSPGFDPDSSIEEEQDASAEGKALLLDPADQAGAAEGSLSGLASPVDFSRAAIVRPTLHRHSATDAFSLSLASRTLTAVAATASNAGINRAPLRQLAEAHEVFAPDSDSGSSDDEDGPETSLEVHGVVVPSLTEESASKRNSIKFHDTVRIHGGIKRQKKRRRKPRPPNLASPSQPRGRDGSHQYSPREPSPLRELFTDLKQPANPSPSLHRTGAFSSASNSYFDSGPGTPTSSTFGIGPGTTGGTRTPPALPPGSAAAAFFHRPSPYSLSSSPATNIHPSHIPISSRSRRPSSTTSFRGGGGTTDGYGSGFASVLTSATQSRSSSPASSIYAPLRVPAVRAPAPFFGPTPERLTRMREKKEAARREAERSKGGWRSWWFGESKGKGKAVSEESAEVVDDDEENAPCYHDVIIEHERTRRERRLSRLRSASVGSSLPPHPELDSSRTEAHSSLWSRLWGRPPANEAPVTSERRPSHLVHKHLHPHVHPSSFPTHGPLPSPAPGRGRPLHRTRSGLLSAATTPLPDVSEDEVMTSTAVRTATTSTAGDTVTTFEPTTYTPPPDARTPLLGNKSPAPSPALLSSPFNWWSTRQRRARRRRRLKPKTEVYVRFGPAPRRWVKGAWWRWRWRMVRRWCAEKLEVWREWWREWWEGEEDWEDERAHWERV